MDLLDLLNIPTPEMPLVCGAWAKKPNVILFHGEAGLGKSIFLGGIAIHISLGKKFLTWDIPKPRKVVLFDGEMVQSLQAMRFQKIVKGIGQAPQPGMFSYVNFAEYEDKANNIPPELPDLASHEGQQEYERRIGDAEVVIIDNLLNAAKLRHGENDAAQWLRIKPWLIKQRSEGRTLIIVHHTNKSGAQYGSGLKRNEICNEVGLTYPGGYDREGKDGFIFKIMKQRTILPGEDSKPKFVRFYDDEITGGIKFESKTLKEHNIERLTKLQESHGDLRLCAAIAGLSYEYAASILATRKEIV